MKFAGLTFVLMSLIYAGSPAMSKGGGLPVGSLNTAATEEDPEENAAGKALTDIDILNKLNAGSTDSELIQEIQTSPTAFDISPPSLAFLRKHGVSQAVINAMIKSAGGKPAPSAITPPVAPSVPPPAPPAAVEPVVVEPAKSVPALAAKPKAPKPDLHKVRKVVLVTEWAEDVNLRPTAIASIEKRTCLKVVDSLDDADAKVKWTTQGLMGVAILISSKDDVDLWARRGFIPPLKALRLALGCE